MPATKTELPAAGYTVEIYYDDGDDMYTVTDFTGEFDPFETSDPGDAQSEADGMVEVVGGTVRAW